jgi:hypothetical protein
MMSLNLEEDAKLMFASVTEVMNLILFNSREVSCLKGIESKKFRPLLTVQDLRTDFTFFFDRAQFSDTDPKCQGSDLWIW